MTVTDVAFGSASPRRQGPPPSRRAVAAFAAALAGSGLVALAVVYSGAGTYAAIAREAGFADTTSFRLPAGAPAATEQHIDLETLVDLHERWVAYVLGRAETGPGTGAFTVDEVRHMANVRSLFIAAQAEMYLAAGVAIAVLGFALRRGQRTAALLIRGGAVVAGAAVLVIGVVAATAFEPAFLAFHYVFFPQGNFLFDPATSNLIRLYPEGYWYRVTLRVGVTFVGMAVALAVAGWLLARSVIVTRQ